MSDRPTPETNSIIRNAQAADHPPTRLAATLTVKCEKLERERDEAREKYDNLATEHMLSINKICNERDEAREALERISHASMDARHKEEDYAEWEKAVFVLLDICEERKVK